MKFNKFEFHRNQINLNYLAHLFLSGTNEDVIVGNFIGDSLKGVDIQKYNLTIQKGVQLHRHIDEFTDHHPVVKQSKALIRKHFNKFTPVVVDVYYDFFLANTWLNHSNVTLENFALNKYQVLTKHHDLLPYGAQRFLYYMKLNNILVAYKTMEGISKVFWGMNQRTKFESKMELAHEILPAYENQIAVHFNQFFKELKNEVQTKFKIDI